MQSDKCQAKFDMLIKGLSAGRDPLKGFHRSHKGAGQKNFLEIKRALFWICNQNSSECRVLVANIDSSNERWFV
jgi:hypothetical protein